MAKFLHSVWFRCISVLLIISVISGGLLAVLNDILYVTAAERTARAVAKIYGKTIPVEEENIILDVDSENPDKTTPIEYEFGRIDKIFIINDDLLFQTVGYNGYKNGTVTLWIKVILQDGVYKTDKIILESYKKQTLMSKFGDSYFEGFKLTDITESYENGDYFTSETGVNSNPNTGATLSANACCNAVNCVIKYMGENHE